MRKLGMGALLGVAQGSVREPRLLVHALERRAARATTPVAFIGKGVTFDTGGISIKPAARAWKTMKWDMGGAGAVAGAMKALAGRKAKANVVGVCGLVENMPDGNAQRPGDVVTTMSGQTIEVINTDAEGRLVLCDAMTWAQRIQAEGDDRPRHADRGDDHQRSAMNMPACSPTTTELAGGADQGRRRYERRQVVAAAAGRGLRPADRQPDRRHEECRPARGGVDHRRPVPQRFVEDGVAWAHLDIAGMVWSDKAKPTYDKGATGFGVRLLDHYIADTVEAG